MAGICRRQMPYMYRWQMPYMCVWGSLRGRGYLSIPNSGYLYSVWSPVRYTTYTCHSPSILFGVPLVMYFCCRSPAPSGRVQMVALLFCLMEERMVFSSTVRTRRSRTTFFCTCFLKCFPECRNAASSTRCTRFSV